MTHPTGAEAEQLLGFATRIGMLLMENGAEVYRAEDTMQRICHAVPGVTEIDVLATPGWLFVSFKAGGESFTKMRRVKTQSIDLYRLREINDISRRVTAKTISYRTADRLLEAMATRTRRHKVTAFLGGVVAAMCITLLGRTSLWDALWAGLGTACMLGADLLMDRFHLSFFVRTFVGSAVGAFAALLFFRLGWVGNVDRVIIGCIMLQFPGLTVANSMRDALSGDFLSGLSEMMQALATAFAVAMGVGFMLLLMGGPL